MFRVVIADDEVTIRNGLKSLIESYHLDLHVVATVEDGKEAIEVIEEYRPEIILMDINMPFINGLKVIERARELDKDSKIIIISGYDQFEYAQKALELGVFSYLLKPIDYRSFKNIITKAVESYSNRIWETSILKDGVTNRAGSEDVGNLAINYIKENFSKNYLSLNLVAEKYHISESYLTRVIKQKTGLTFTDYLNKLRISMAINLLMDKGKVYTINEISYMVGYNSQHYFSRAFKNYVGLSPNQYRNEKTNVNL
ncbi:response regulator [Alkaliphilus sp. MSJ-5]|uniref:Response regulator n=1 Tax=Alkaliphilus flagellatus TaxID=2841507 RepID=A0ABS6G1H5_9FIRM|nr:response regulator [Alkaliphilus flagellatus]MBU5676214.1 response regulator [Alkaliphilus flagellatus]